MQIYFLFKNKFMILLAVLILLIFLHFIKILKPLENYLLYFFLPVQADLYQTGVEQKANWNWANLNQKELIEINKKLETENQNLIIEKSKLLEAQAENSDLRKNLNFFENNQHNYVTARIVGNNFDQNIYSYIINKGSDDGIEKEQAVIAGEGVIIGKIYKVFPKKSEVLLLTDQRSAIATNVQNKESSMGVVEGEYGLVVRMNLIPQNEIINVGDLVITSGIESKIPRGLVVGKVSSVSTEINELFQTAIIYPAVNYKQLNIVSVIINKEKE
jgi:rod shape-determining protein MreC